MPPEQFIQARQADWQALTRLLDRCQRDVHQLSPEEVQVLGRLYRAASSDLALAQRDFPNQRVATYLNQLVARAHGLLYRGEPLAVGRLWRFVASGFPRVFRATLPFTLLAAALFIIPAVAAGLGTALDPATARWLLPEGVQPVIAGIERQELWIDLPVNERPYAASFIMTNNIQVVFLAYAGGALAGLVTVWAMIYNGLILGGLTGLTLHYGIGGELWAFVIGHGVIELSVIFMAGGAGLSLGWAILRPGLLRRRDALAVAARQTVRLIIGCVPLLVIAGLIEGFISPAESLPVVFKWAFGLFTGVLLYAYLFLAGRERRVGQK